MLVSGRVTHSEIILNGLILRQRLGAAEKKGCFPIRKRKSLQSEGIQWIDDMGFPDLRIFAMF